MITSGANTYRVFSEARSVMSDPYWCFRDFLCRNGFIKDSPIEQVTRPQSPPRGIWSFSVKLSQNSSSPDNSIADQAISFCLVGWSTLDTVNFIRLFDRSVGPMEAKCENRRPRAGAVYMVGSRIGVPHLALLREVSSRRRFSRSSRFSGPDGATTHHFVIHSQSRP
ncbi:hypothetical protein EVAR_57251_1 [Eumeta japonica]|uniref:Uncharacterized protein n=1 Tax=Eumeta variegata TaxID=151549 RepID=A0A4C1YRH2_EUMVA|nr:hypothetical protein EVAR_57251_1 [Eumeta japonica]